MCLLKPQNLLSACERNMNQLWVRSCRFNSETEMNVLLHPSTLHTNRRSCVCARQMCNCKSPFRANDFVHLRLTPLALIHPASGHGNRRCAWCLFFVWSIRP